MYNFKNVKNTHGGVLILVKLQAGAIWYHFYNLKNVKKYPWRSVNFSKDAGFFVQFKKRENTHGGALILVKLQAEAFEHISHLFLVVYY